MRPNQYRQLTGVIICNGDEIITAFSIQRSSIVKPTFAHATRVEEYRRLLIQAFAARRKATRNSLSMLGQVFDSSREGFLIAGTDASVLEYVPSIGVLLWETAISRCKATA